MLIAFQNALLIGIISFFVYRTQPDELRGFFVPAVLIKLIAGIALGLVYHYYYAGGDTFNLFVQAREQTLSFYSDPGSWLRSLLNNDEPEMKGYLRSSFFVRIVSCFNILTSNNYWITGLWLSFIGFLGSWQLFRVLNLFFAGSAYAAAFAFLFFPSIVFWSAGIIKESLSLAGLYFLAAVFLKLFMRVKPHAWEWIIALLSCWIVWNLKYYWVALFAPLACAALLIKRISAAWTVQLRVLLWTCIIILTGAVVPFLHPNFYPGRFLFVLVENHDAFISLSDPQNVIHYWNLKPTWESVILNSPWALWSGLFRPLPFQGHGLLAWLPSIENVILLLLTLTALSYIRFLRSTWRLLTIPALLYCFALCIFLALSTPNLGSLARYKVGFVPFFAFIVTYRNPMVEWLMTRLSGMAKSRTFDIRTLWKIR